MEYYLFELLYRGLNWEKMRTTKRISKYQVKNIKQHFLLLKTALQLILAIDFNVKESYLQLLQGRLINLINNNNEFQIRYNSAILYSNDFKPEEEVEHQKALEMLCYIFLEIDDCLTQRINMKSLNMLFRSAHNLPRCMLMKGYLDESYIRGISQDECIEYSLSNMDSKLREKILRLLS